MTMSITKRGGIRFIRLGRLRISMCVAKAQPVEHGSLRDIAQITLAVILISAAYLGPIIAFGG